MDYSRKLANIFIWSGDNEVSEMDDKIKHILSNLSRYKNFTILDEPIAFNTLFRDKDFSTVQLHSIETCGDDDIVGFCGVVSWIDEELTPLDHDSYYPSMKVYGYEEWNKNGETMLDILVFDW